VNLTKPMVRSVCHPPLAKNAKDVAPANHSVELKIILSFGCEMWWNAGAFGADVYYLIPLPPLPPVFWNHEVSRNFSIRSLNLKDLCQSIPE